MILRGCNGKAEGGLVSFPATHYHRHGSRPRLRSLIPVLVLCALLGVCFALGRAAAVTNYFRGQIVRGCDGGLNVIWTNVPAAVVVEHSVDLTNWAAVLTVSVPPGQEALKWFSYPAGSNSAAVYMRLRQISPIAIQ